MDNKKIFEEVNKLISDYETSPIQIVKGLYYSQNEVLQKIEFYWNSKYINGQKDELGRIKPFYNISKFRVNVATRATDLDVKDITVKSDNPTERIRSLVLNHEIYKWMKESNFSKVLNEAGKTRAKYGGVLVKKFIEDDNLKIEVVNWKNTITDQVNILDGSIVEIHYMSPSELSKKIGIWDNVEDAMELATKTRKEGTDASEKKVPIYEVHGEFPQTLNPEKKDGDKNIYEQMSFIIAGHQDQDQVVLWFEEEDEMPYKYLAWDDVYGRGLGIGIVEDGFEAQMWTNDAIIAEKNVMDLAGKVYIKTTSKKFGNNILTDSDTGTIFDVEEGSSTEVMNLVPSSLPQFQNLVEKWSTQYERSTNTFDAVTGETLPSGTPLGSTAIQSAQASSFFDYRREEAGIFWTEVFMEWVLPFLIKKINKQHILASDFSNEELAMIDEAFSVSEANELVKQRILSGEFPSREEYESYIAGQKEFLKIDGKRRYLDVPDRYFKGFEARVTIDPTGEKKNKDAILQSLFTVMTQISSNPAILSDPTLLGIFNEMLELSGLNFQPIPLQPQMQGSGQTGTSKSPISNGSALEKQTTSTLPLAQQ